VVFDVPFLAGADLRGLPWQDRRDRLELLSRAFAEPYELSPVIEPSVALALDMAQGRLEGIVLKDRQGSYRDGSRRGWSQSQGSILDRTRGLAVRFGDKRMTN